MSTGEAAKRQGPAPNLRFSPLLEAGRPIPVPQPLLPAGLAGLPTKTARWQDNLLCFAARRIIKRFGA